MLHMRACHVQGIGRNIINLVINIYFAMTVGNIVDFIAVIPMAVSRHGSEKPLKNDV